MRWKFALAPLVVLTCFASIGLSQSAGTKDSVYWCHSIPVPDVWKEARLSAVFQFDVDEHGKPKNVHGLRVPLVKDDTPFLQCISNWSISSLSGKVTAVIRWKWSCIDIEVSSAGARKVFPCQPSNPSN
jgi:hypothetical protein